MKKLLSVLLAVGMLLNVGSAVTAQTNDRVVVTLDGTEVNFPDAQPFIDARNRTLVPIRFVSEAMGARVDWENETQTVTVKKDKDTVKYTIGNMKAYLNDEIRVFDTYGILKEDRTFVPLRFISEMLSCNVDWNDTVKTVTIVSPGEAVKFPEPKITVHYPESESDKRLFWVTLDMLPDGTEEKTGNRDTVSVTLTETAPHKILKVNCLTLDQYGGNEDVDDIPDPTITIKPAGDCNGIIEWTETDSHKVFVGYTSSGRRKYKTCTHSFDYRATLTAESDITPDTLKSGYGFEMDINCKLNTKLVSSSGGCTSWGKNRTALMYVKDPTKATVYIPWEMKNNLGTQSKTITMDSNGTLKFRLPVSNVSQAGARKIYTPVELAGTSEEPVSHDFEVYISGGGIEGVEFCQKLIGTITINGDMYEDDFSGSD